MPEISVVLPTYNGERYIRESIDSIINQSYTNWELIVVNDCSTDDTRLIVEEYAKKDNRIRIINNEKNRKLPKSLNIGFQNARGNYYTWISDDNIFAPTALGKMKDCLNSNPDTPMVVGFMGLINEIGECVGQRKCEEWKYIICRNTVGACFMYRADVARIVGEYDASLFLVEDYDYWLRIVFSFGGYKIINEELYQYRVHDNNLSNTRRKEVKEALYRLRSRYLEKLLNVSNGDEELVFLLFCEMLEDGRLTSDQKKILTENCKLLDIIVPYDGSRPCVIYGAGKYGKALQKIVNNIVFFVDKNPDLFWKRVENIEIRPPESLKMMDRDIQLIVAVNHLHLYSVIKELIKMGIGALCISQCIVGGKMTYEEFEDLI